MKLEAWLHSKGLTASDFAARLGRDESTITRLIPADGKKQVRKPGWELMAEISEATGGAVTANDFMDAPECDTSLRPTG